MRLPRLEPGGRQLSHLRAVFDPDALVAYLDDPKSSKRLRRRVALTIGSIAPGGGRAAALNGPTDPAIVPCLSALLKSDPDAAVRRAAAYGLRRTGEEAAMGPLLRALSDTDPATRDHAVWGLGDLQARDAVDPLIGLLEDDGYAPMIARALVRIGDGRAIGPLWLGAMTAAGPRRRKQLEGAAIELEVRAGMRAADRGSG